MLERTFSNVIINRPKTSLFDTLGIFCVRVWCELFEIKLPSYVIFAYETRHAYA